MPPPRRLLAAPALLYLPARFFVLFLAVLLFARPRPGTADDSLLIPPH